MQQYLGFSWPQGHKVDYYKFRDQADYLRNGQCPDDSDSCTVDSTVFSPHVLQDHELIHAYLAPLGLPPAFFVEGIARVLAGDSTFELQAPKPWRDVVTLPFEQRLSRAYLEGAWFVGYLLHRYGPAPFLSLYQRLDHQTASVETIASTFESVYGEVLDSVWNAGLDSSRYVRGVNLWNCSGASLPLDGTILPLEQACDGSANSRTFEVSAGADVDVVILSRRYFLFAPLSCDEELPLYVGGNDVAHEYGVVFDSTLVSVPKGKYFVRSAAQGGVPDVGVRMLASPAYARDCHELDAVDLSTDEFWTTGDMKLSIPKDGNAWFVKLHLRTSTTFYTGSDATDEVQECSSCGDAPVCVPLDGDAHPDADGNVTLRLASPEPGPGYASYLIRGFPMLP